MTTTTAPHPSRSAPPQINKLIALLDEAQALAAAAQWINPEADHAAQEISVHLSQAQDAIHMAVGLEDDWLSERGL